MAPEQVNLTEHIRRTFFDLAKIAASLRSGQAEILAGIAFLPKGSRRAELETMARATFSQDFDGRVLPFGREATTAYADLYALRRQKGRPIATADLIIAAVARANDATVVTRDVGGFSDCGLAIIDPWMAAL